MNRPLLGTEWVVPVPIVAFTKVALCPACRSLLITRADLSGIRVEWDKDEELPACPPWEHRQLEREARAEWERLQPIRTGGDN
jgi:hypothetical protein